MTASTESASSTRSTGSTGSPWFERREAGAERPAAGTGGDDVPVYDRLVAERGDVLAAARRAVEQVRREAADALDWSGLGERA